jgi:hypothetical protein
MHTYICRDQGPKCSCLCIAHPPLCSPGWHLWPVQRTRWAARCFTTFQMAPKRSWNRTSKPGCKRLWINKYIYVQLHSYITIKWLCVYIYIHGKYSYDLMSSEQNFGKDMVVQQAGSSPRSLWPQMPWFELDMVGPWWSDPYASGNLVSFGEPGEHEATLNYAFRHIDIILQGFYIYLCIHIYIHICIYIYIYVF